MNKQRFYREIEAHFNLRTNKTMKPEMVYLVVRIDGKQYKLSSGVKVYPSQWHKGIAEESNLLCKRDNNNNKIVNEKLTVLKKRYSEFISYLCNCDNEITDMGGLLKQFIYKDMVNKRIKEEKSGKKVTNVCEIITEGFDYYYQYVSKSKKESTKNTFRKVLNHYLDYLPTLKEADKANVFTQKGILKYKEYLIDKMKKSANESIKFGVGQVNKCGELIVRLINEVLYINKRDEINIPIELVKWQKVKDARNKEDVGHFYLEKDEIEAIKSVDALSTKEKEYRDLFLLHLNCGLRVSDIHKLIEKDYKEESNTYIVRTVKEDINAFVSVTEELKALLDKVRNSSIAKFEEPKYNKAIKAICKKANLSRTIERKDSLGNDDSKPLYDAISSHCARYTFIRIMCEEKGYQPNEVAMMVGHVDDTMIKEVYNKLSQLDRIKKLNEAKVRVEAKKEGKLVEVSNDARKKTTLINAFFAYDDIISLMDMKESGISIYDDVRLKKAISIIKKSVTKTTIDKATRLFKDTDKDTVTQFKKNVDSINSFIWNIGKHFADTKLYMMYQYKQNKLGLLEGKLYTENELDDIWQAEIYMEESDTAKFEQELADWEEINNR